MSITPVDSSVAPAAPEASFDDAVQNAQTNPESEQMNQVFEQGIGVLMQTILTPKMNEILSEATSDE